MIFPELIDNNTRELIKKNWDFLITYFHGGAVVDATILLIYFLGIYNNVNKSKKLNLLEKIQKTQEDFDNLFRLKHRLISNFVVTPNVLSNFFFRAKSKAFAGNKEEYQNFLRFLLNYLKENNWIEQWSKAEDIMVNQEFIGFGGLDDLSAKVQINTKEEYKSIITYNRKLMNLCHVQNPKKLAIYMPHLNNFIKNLPKNIS